MALDSTHADPTTWALPASDEITLGVDDKVSAIAEVSMVAAKYAVARRTKYCNRYVRTVDW
jgi:hypothetical protein